MNKFESMYRSPLTLKTVAGLAATAIVVTMLFGPIVASAKTSKSGSLGNARAVSMAAALYAESSESLESSGAAWAACLQEGAWTTADGGCRDDSTGLVWGSSFYEAVGQHATNPYFPNFFQAQDYCLNSTEGGYDDWRIPSREEMVSAATRHITDYIYIVGTPNTYLFSSTTQGKYVFTVNLLTGEFFKASISAKGPGGTTHYTQVDVRCVRASGPSIGGN